MNPVVVLVIGIVLGAGVITFLVVYLVTTRREEIADEKRQVRSLLVRQLQKKDRVGFSFSAFVENNDIPQEIAQEVARELYQALCAKSFEDGRITAEERRRMDVLRKLLALPVESTEEIERSARNNRYLSQLESALADGLLTSRETTVLAELRHTLGLSVDTAQQLAFEATHENYDREIRLNAFLTDSEVSALHKALKITTRQREWADYSIGFVFAGCLIALAFGGAAVFLLRAVLALGIVLAVLLTTAGIAGAVILALSHRRHVQEHNRSLLRVSLVFEFATSAEMKCYRALTNALQQLSTTIDLRSTSGRKLEIAEECPPFFKCNVDMSVIREAEIGHYFFPDRIVLCSAHEVTSFSYTDLSTTIRRQEETTVNPPSDSTVTSTYTTWLHQRVDGGPDRRYKNNWSTEHYKCLFGRIVIAGPSGVLLEFRASNDKAASRLAETITAMGQLSNRAS